jgi:hypothetical protein
MHKLPAMPPSQSIRRGEFWAAIALLFISFGCGRKPVQTIEVNEVGALNEQQISRLQAKKIFFGHQSVGADVVQGIRDLMNEDHRVRLNLVTSAEPQSTPGPAFIESLIGENRNPRSKDTAFAAILAKGMGSQGGIAMYKYCYVDIGLDTDVQQLFDNYRQEMSDLKAKYPLLVIVHVTVPLTSDDASMKTWVKTLIGRSTSRDVNLKRNQFNALLRKYYSTEPIFDLAQVESTYTDGSRSYVMSRGQKIYTLVPEFTTDGGHLNQAGRRAAAQQLLQVLAGL